MSGIANEVIAKRQNRRLNNFLVSLAKKLKGVSEKINRDFISKEEFQDLTEDIFSKAAETKQKEKLEAMKAIFLNTVLSDKPNYNEAAEMAVLVERWQPRHIILIKILSNPIEADEQMGRVVGNGGGFSTSILQILKLLLPTWDKEQIERTWQELLDVRIHKTDGVRTTITDSGIHQLENRLTDYGIKVVRYIKEPV
ncbi:MAG: hypothetical protein IBV53_05385 [Candidatus Atribacteria bacterium]